MRPFAPASFAVTSLALLAGCSGSNAARQPVAAVPFVSNAKSAAAIALEPARLNFGLGRSRRANVVVTGGTPPYSLAQSNADVADVSKPHRTGRTWSFDVAPTANGTTIVTVRDASGAATAMPVSQEVCVSPTPQFGPLYPPQGATAVSHDLGYAYVSDAPGDPMRPSIHQFYARFVGSDGSVASGAAFAVTRATPPPGSAALPPGSIVVRAAVPRLRSGITYRLLYPTKRRPCIGPLSTGSFTTN